MAVSLEVSKLCKKFYSSMVVDNISFAATQGEVVGFLGPNGAGKTTTMRMLTGFLTPCAGKAKVNGVSVLENQLSAKRQFGYLPEGAPGYPDMSVYGFLSFVAELRGFTGKEKRQRVLQAIEKVKLTDVVYQTIDTLSKGFKRRVGLAQAIIHDPPVLILDEPTDGLDPNQKHEVRSLIKGMAQDKVIIISTHILEEVAAICNRVIVIAGGKLIADSSPDELVSSSIYSNTVKLVVRNTGDCDIEQVFTDIKGVSRVELLDTYNDRVELRLHVAGDHSFSELSQVVLANNLELIGLHANSGQLEEVFRNITQSYQEVI